MKKIFTSVAVLAACATGAFAQKTVDLGFNITNPAELATYPNLAQGDSINFKVAISNNGTDAIIPSDTVLMYTLGYAINTRTNNYAWRSRVLAGMNIAPGATMEYSFWVTKGSGTINAAGDTILNWFFDNDTNAVRFEGFGWDVNGNLFNDAGVDNTDPTGDDALTGNNSLIRQYILGGTSSSVKNINGAQASSLNVFPNPSTGLVNVNYEFRNAAEANVRIMDIAGRLVYTNQLGRQNAGNQTFQLDLSQFAKGLYTVELTTDNEKAVGKINIK